MWCMHVIMHVDVYMRKKLCLTFRLLHILVWQAVISHRIARDKYVPHLSLLLSFRSYHYNSQEKTTLFPSERRRTEWLSTIVTNCWPLEFLYIWIVLYFSVSSGSEERVLEDVIWIMCRLTLGLALDFRTFLMFLVS